MDFIVARQPIFDQYKRVFAYELLYRGSVDTPISRISGERATASLLTSTFLTEGIERISNFKPCFINFPRDLLVKDVLLTFSNKQVVVEVLEDVPPDREVLEACRKLREHDFTIALDDFVYDRSLDPLIDLAQIIKIDFIQTPVDTLERTLHQLSRFDLKLLAEKVETNDEFEKALKLGFSYFQGFFFKRPEHLIVKELTAVKINLLHMLAELSKDDWSVERLESIITKDVSLAYKILRYINSSYFYRINEIKSVTHAITYLGNKEIRRFAMLVIISEIASDKPDELIRLAMIRARFSELLASSGAARVDNSEMFIVGLFSLLDAMLDIDMPAILDRLPLSKLVKDGLLSKQGPYAPYLQFVLAYEEKDRDKCLQFLKLFAPVKGKIHEKYLEAVEFSHSLTAL